MINLRNLNWQQAKHVVQAAYRNAGINIDITNLNWYNAKNIIEAAHNKLTSNRISFSGLNWSNAVNYLEYNINSISLNEGGILTYQSNKYIETVSGRNITIKTV